MTKKIFGKTVLITGASSGIGKEFAFAFAEKKCELVLTGRNKNNLENIKKNVVEKYGTPCKIIIADLSQEKGIFKLITEINNRNLDIDILVNNAGFMTYGYFNKLPLREEINELNVNVLAPICLTHHFLNKMLVKNYGFILNIASTASLLPSCPFESNYCATKAFLLNFSLGLSQEYKNTNVRIKCLLPGKTNTALWSHGNLERKYRNELNQMTDPKKVARKGLELLFSKNNFAIIDNKLSIKLLAHIIPRNFISKVVRKMHYEKYL